MQELRCIDCSGYAPFMFMGTSYCQVHLKRAYVAVYGFQETDFPFPKEEQ